MERFALDRAEPHSQSAGPSLRKRERERDREKENEKGQCSLRGGAEFKKSGRGCGGGRSASPAMNAKPKPKATEAKSHKSQNPHRSQSHKTQFPP